MNEKIKVEFPRKMEVTSPEIDSLSRVAQRISNWLHTDLREIVKPLQVLPELPKMLAQLQTTVADRLHQLLSGQLVAQMKAREANIRVARRKAELVAEHLAEKERQLDDSKKRIEARYRTLAEQSAEQHQRYLERLDSHTYELTDRVYPDEIQVRFSADSFPYWRVLAAHAGESALARAICLHEGYLGARRVVEQFLGEREDFRTELRELTTDAAEEGPLELPFWFAVVEDPETGETTTEIVFPWELEDGEKDVEVSDQGALRSFASKGIDLEESEPLASVERSLLEICLKNDHDVPAEELRRLRGDCRRLWTGGA